MRMTIVESDLCTTIFRALLEWNGICKDFMKATTDLSVLTEVHSIPVSCFSGRDPETLLLYPSRLDPAHGLGRDSSPSPQRVLHTV